MPYPTVQHRLATEAAVEFFSAQEGVEAILLICSLARGTATPQSDLDLGILVRPGMEWQAMRECWDAFYQRNPVFADLLRISSLMHVDVSFTDGCFTLRGRGVLSGPDAFELEIGNFLAYSKLLWRNGPYYQELEGKWLPYYDDVLRQNRLQEAIKYCRINLEHVQVYVERGLHFQAHSRFYLAVQDFLHGLFVVHRKYPVAYNKWIRDQFINILDLPELYRLVVSLFEIHHLEAGELAQKAEALDTLTGEYLKP